MDSPWVFAVVAFFAIYLLFFIISLLADIYIVAVALLSAIFAFNIPKWYPELYSSLNELAFLDHIGLTLAAQPTSYDYYTIIALVVILAVFLCIPVLPFSATYRQMLGANRLSKHEEACVKRLVTEEIANLQVEPVEEENDDDLEQQQRPSDNKKVIEAEQKQAMSLIIESEKEEQQNNASQNREDPTQHPRDADKSKTQS